MGESVVGYAQHLLMLTTKLNAREHDDVIYHQARAEAQRWMREDADVEVRAEQVLVLSLIHI